MKAQVKYTGSQIIALRQLHKADGLLRITEYKRHGKTDAYASIVLEDGKPELVSLATARSLIRRGWVHKVSATVIDPQWAILNYKLTEAGHALVVFGRAAK